MNDQSDEREESGVQAESERMTGGAAEAGNEFLSEGQEGQITTDHELLAARSRPRTLSVVAGGTALLAGAVAALLWLPRRPSVLPRPSSNGAAPGSRRRRARLLGGRQGSRRATTVQERMVLAAGWSSDRARRAGRQLMTRAGQRRRQPKQTRWQTVRTQVQGAAGRTEGNRVTLAALLVAAILVGAARWIDRQQRAGREE